jgi:hypothetical protein
MDNPNNCPDPECRRRVDVLTSNKKFWNRILDSKWFFWAVTGLVVLWLGFGGWVVREIYAQKSNEEKNKAVAEVISKDVKEIKQELKRDNEKRDEQRERDQRKLVEMLMEIQKQIKK